MGSRHRRRPQVDVPGHAGGRARDGRPRRGRRHLRLVDRGPPRLRPDRVRHGQGRGDRVRPLGRRPA
ncbi:MAG: hypothetical protein DMD99_08790, partial [Candidatus Rokuibacteriota bacterium]